MNQSLLDAIRLAKEQGVTLIVVQPDAPTKMLNPIAKIGYRHDNGVAEPLVHTDKGRGSVLDPREFLRKRRASARGGPYGMPTRNRYDRRQTEQSFRFGCWLTEQMNRHGISDKRLAAALGMPESIHTYRAGRWMPTAERRALFERYFQMLEGKTAFEIQPERPQRRRVIYSGPDGSADSQQTEEGIRFGRWLTELMNYHALTDQQMSQATGIPTGSFGKMRVGGYLPNRERLEKIIRFFVGLAEGSAQPATAPAEAKRQTPWSEPILGQPAPKRVRRHHPKRAPGEPYRKPRRGPAASDVGYEFACWFTEQLNKHKLTVRDVADATGINTSRINAMRLGCWFPPVELRSKVEALFEEKPVAAQASS